MRKIVGLLGVALAAGCGSAASNGPRTESGIAPVWAAVGRAYEAIQANAEAKAQPADQFVVRDVITDPNDTEHVRFEQKWSTAIGVATGTLPAQEAFLQGLIKLHGDKDRLVANQAVLAALEPVFRRVKEHTDYA